MVDALRARNLGCYGYGKPTSPNIDRLAASGVLLEQAYSTTNVTDVSITTILSGKYPPSHGILYHRVHSEEEVQRFTATGTRLLPQMLQAMGYRTMAIDWLGEWLVWGYDYYSGSLVERPPNPSHHPGQLERIARLLLWRTPHRLARVARRVLNRPGKPDAACRTFGDAMRVSQRATELMRQNSNQKFFLFVHFWDTHFPYHPGSVPLGRFYGDIALLRESVASIPNEAKRRKLQALQWDVRRASAAYDASISYVDQAIGKLLQAVAELGLEDKTLVVLTADHGESLAEHGIYFDHHGLYNELIHVPLILRHPRLPGGKRVSGLVQHTDIVPSLCEIIGRAPEADIDGLSFLPLIRGEAQELRGFVYAMETFSQEKSGIATHKYKYMRAPTEAGGLCRLCSTVHGGIEELYDLQSDPAESRNIASQSPEVAAHLRETLTTYESCLRDKRERAHIRRTIAKLKAQGEARVPPGQ